MEQSKKDRVVLARLVATSLRHDPEGVGITISEDGWVSLASLAEGISLSTEYDITRQELWEILNNHGRGRFELEEGRVRAKTGHTTKQFTYDVVEPPDNTFYRMIPLKDAEEVREYGLGLPARTRGGERYIKIYKDPLEAAKDGSRRHIKEGYGVLVEVLTHQAYHGGLVFYRYAGSYYVTELPARFIVVQDVHEP